MKDTELKDAGPTLAEETERKLRWELRRTKELLEQQTQAAINWRASFHESQRYLNLVHPKLAAAAEDSNFQRWEVSL